MFERLLHEGESVCTCGFVCTVLAAIGQPLHARVPGIKMQFGFQKYAVPVMTNYIQFGFTLLMTNLNDNPHKSKFVRSPFLKQTPDANRDFLMEFISANIGPTNLIVA